jgi:hypothetical protein
MNDTQVNGRSFASKTLLSILFSLILILGRVFFIDLYSGGLLSLGQLTLFFITILLFIIGLTQLFPYIIHLLSTPKRNHFKILIISTIIIFGFLITCKVDPVEVDFFLYLSRREEAVSLIELGQTKTAIEVIKKNRNYFKIRSVFIEHNSIYLERYTVGFGEGGYGYIYTVDEERIAELNKIKLRKLKEHWFWR